MAGKPLKSRAGGTGVAGRFMDRVDRACFAVLTGLVGISFALMLLSVFLSVALRELGLHVFPWMEEASGYLVVWSVFLSAAVLARRNAHISVDIFYEQVSPSVRKLINVLTALLGIVLVGFLAYLGWGFSYTAYRFGDVSLSGYIPVWLGYVAIPLGLGLTALAYFLWLIDLIRGKQTSAPKSVDSSDNFEGGGQAW